MYRFVYIIFHGNEIGFILISSRKQPLENGTWLFNLDGILFGFPVVLSSLSAFSKETVWAITILLISQRLIRHSYGGEEWLHSGTHFITITCFTHLELIFPWGARDSNSKASHNCKWKRKKQLFNRAADNDIFKEIFNRDTPALELNSETQSYRRWWLYYKPPASQFQKAVQFSRNELIKNPENIHFRR